MNLTVNRWLDTCITCFWTSTTFRAADYQLLGYEKLWHNSNSIWLVRRSLLPTIFIDREIALIHGIKATNHFFKVISVAKKDEHTKNYDQKKKMSEKNGSDKKNVNNLKSKAIKFMAIWPIKANIVSWKIQSRYANQLTGIVFFRVIGIIASTKTIYAKMLLMVEQVWKIIGRLQDSSLPMMQYGWDNVLLALWIHRFEYCLAAFALWYSNCDGFCFHQR